VKAGPPIENASQTAGRSRLWGYVFGVGLAGAIGWGWWMSGKSGSDEPAKTTAVEARKANRSTIVAEPRIEPAASAQTQESQADRVKYVLQELEKSYNNYLTRRAGVLAEHEEIERLRQLLDRLPYDPIYDQLGEAGKQVFFEFRKANPDFVKQHYRQVGLKTKANAFLQVAQDEEWASILKDVFENAGLKESLKNVMTASDEASGFKPAAGQTTADSYGELPGYLEARVDAYQRALAQDAAKFQLPAAVTAAMQLEWERSIKITVLKLYVNSYLRSDELNAAAKETQRWLSELGNDPRQHPSPNVTDLVETIKMNIGPSL
jgi:hypothetical protein